MLADLNPNILHSKLQFLLCPQFSSQADWSIQDHHENMLWSMQYFRVAQWKYRIAALKIKLSKLLKARCWTQHSESFSLTALLMHLSADLPTSSLSSTLQILPNVLHCGVVCNVDHNWEDKMITVISICDLSWVTAFIWNLLAFVHLHQILHITTTQ